MILPRDRTRAVPSKRGTRCACPAAAVVLLMVSSSAHAQSEPRSEEEGPGEEGAEAPSSEPAEPADTSSASSRAPTTATAAHVQVEQPVPREPVAEAEPLELPPDPYSLDPVISVGFQLGLVVPVAREPLCPSGSDCVFQGGGSVGVVLERRWPSGPAIGLAYQLWFLDASGIYEFGLLQELRVQARYLFLMEAILHPYVGAGIGAIVFGDTFKVATVGVAIDGYLGVELELTETISVQIAMPWRVFRLDSFTTRRDRVRRSEDSGFNIATSLELGLAITGLR